MYPHKIRIKNIGPFVDEKVDLESVPGALVAVTGRNGEGKTMFMESIFAGAYREFPTRPVGIYRFCTDRNAGIELEFSMGNKVYQSTLNFDSKNRKMEAVLAHDGQPLNDGKTSTFDAEAIKILGYPDQILASSYGAQNKKGNFTELEKSARKELFIQMIGLSKLQKISETANKFGQVLEPKKTILTGQLSVLQSTASQPIPDIESLSKSLQEKQAQQDKCKDIVARAEGQIAAHKIKLEQLNSMNAELKATSGRIQQLELSKEDLNRNLGYALSGAQLLSKHKDHITIKSQELGLIKERLAVLRNKVSNLDNVRNQELMLASKLRKAIEECQATASKIKSQEILSANVGSLREKSLQLEQLRVEVDSDSKTMRQLSAETVRLVQEESERSRIISEINLKISSLQKEEAKALMLLEMAHSKAGKLKEVPCRGEGVYASCQFIKDAAEATCSIDDLEAGADNVKAALLAAKQELDNIPKIDPAVEIRVMHQYRVLADKNTESENLIKRLTLEVKDLPIAESASSQIELLKQQLAIQENARDLASVDHEACEIDLSEMMSVKKDINQLEIETDRLSSDIVNLNTMISAAETCSSEVVSLKIKIANIEAELSARKERIGELMVSVDGLEAIKAEYDAAVKDIDASRKDLANIANEVLAIQRDVTRAEKLQEEIVAAKNKVVRVEEDLAIINYRIACYANVAKAFGPMEIQSFEIDSAGPEVSRLANELLFNCFGPRFSIKFITQELKADGKGYKDEFDVSVYDQNSSRWNSISDLSGGERTIVSEALSLAIALYNKEKNGVAWDTLFRDEVSGALDDVYAPQYITMLRAAKEMGHFKRVLFICHQERLKEMADSRIVISHGKIEVEA